MSEHRWAMYVRDMIDAGPEQVSRGGDSPPQPGALRALAAAAIRSPYAAPRSASSAPQATTRTGHLTLSAKSSETDSPTSTSVVATRRAVGPSSSSGCSAICVRISEDAASETAS